MSKIETYCPNLIIPESDLVQLDFTEPPEIGYTLAVNRPMSMPMAPCVVVGISGNYLADNTIDVIMPRFTSVYNYDNDTIDIKIGEDLTLQSPADSCCCDEGIKCEQGRDLSYDQYYQCDCDKSIKEQLHFWRPTNDEKIKYKVYSVNCKELAWVNPLRTIQKYGAQYFYTSS